MKALTLEDMSREELLAWIRQSVMARAMFACAVRQVDLLSVRHETLQKKETAAELARNAAWDARAAAWDAKSKAKYGTRRQVDADLAYMKADAAYKRAVRLGERASAESQECWTALMAEYDRRGA